MEKVGEIKKINTENERIYAQKLMLDRAKYTSELEWYESGKAKYDAAIKQYQNDLSSYERDINDESISRRNRIKLRRDEIYKQYFEEHHFETSVKILAKLFAQGTEETIYFANDSNTALFFLLYSAWLSADFNNKILAVNFKLPLIDDIPTVIDVKELKTSDDVKEKRMTTAARERFYDDVLYKICLGSIHLLFAADKSNFFDAVVFNGYVDYIDKATGKDARAFIMSLQTTKQEFNNIDLLRIDPKTCFKSLKGVGSSKLYSITPIRPILNISKEDARFVDAVDVASSIDASTNLAAIDWQEFEQLIRQVFDKEFSQNGGEVKITQASRDGGVDAVAFDNDPIRGGKIVIQAKRYTNTVGVSAVRDLYGTVMNEGAMKGILVTTSDFGPDAHSFAKDKPLTLISGAELLYLFQKHGYEARINLQEAKAEAAQKANSSTK
jgi:restriction system protein